MKEDKKRRREKKTQENELKREHKAELFIEEQKMR
jgi:hypothetical protein